MPFPSQGQDHTKLHVPRVERVVIRYCNSCGTSLQELASFVLRIESIFVCHFNFKYNEFVSHLTTSFPAQSPVGDKSSFN